VYEFPKTRLVDGPLQIEARIDQNAQLSGQLSLLRLFRFGGVNGSTSTNSVLVSPGSFMSTKFGSIGCAAF
jgi:uncharacterized membrane protein (UPF0182 family)